jgi:mono/diheme cytochrome c family protein
MSAFFGKYPRRGGPISVALVRQILVPMVAIPLVLGCSRDQDEVREWSPGDHDHTGSPSPGQVDTSQAPASPLAQHGVSDVALATWKQNCVPCHGVIGRGDGPQGRMLRPPDFTHPVWQKNALDDHLRRTIMKGRGAMPPFGHLPEDTVDGLIQLIRLLNRERAQAPANTAAPGAATAPPVDTQPLQQSPTAPNRPPSP